MPKDKEMPEFKTFKFKVEKAESSDNIGYIDGYASTFGNVDLGDDVIDRGAFARTIKNSGGKFPILLDHDPTQQIGWNLEATEDEKGLRVRGMVNLITEAAKNRYALAKQACELGTQMGLSIGYRTLQWAFDSENQNIRHLKELKLFEYSLVTFPMNTMAGVTGAKFQQFADLFDRLQKGGYSLERIEEALKMLGSDQSAASPAAKQADPEILHSVDKMIQLLKA
jgi:HK97 family phage prohead protease